MAYNTNINDLKWNTTKEEIVLKDWLLIYPPKDIEGEWNWIDKTEKQKITISYIRNKYYIDFKKLNDNDEYVTRFTFQTEDINWFDWFVQCNLIYFD